MNSRQTISPPSRGCSPDAAVVTDKRPDNFLYVGLIKSLFPDARIVHTTRDPLDNCLSVHFLHLDHAMGYALDLMDTAHYYRQYRRLMAHWKSLYGDDILDFDYDTFVRDPGPAVERLLAFCGLDWEERLHGISPRAQRGQDGERLAGARAALPALVGPLAKLRATARAAARLPWRPSRRAGGRNPLTPAPGVARIRGNAVLRPPPTKRDVSAVERVAGNRHSGR